MPGVSRVAVYRVLHERPGSSRYQFDHFQGYPHAIREAEENPKISFMTESVVEGFLGEDELTGTRIRHQPTGEITTIDATVAAGAAMQYITVGERCNSPQL
jgi:thioredoxin reductase